MAIHSSETGHLVIGTLHTSSAAAVSNLIREGKTFQIESTIQTSKNIGMVTMEQSHFDLYMEGKRSYDQTLPFIHTPDLKRQMQMREAQKLNGGMPMPPQGATPSPQPPQQDQAKKRNWF